MGVLVYPRDEDSHPGPMTAQFTRQHLSGRGLSSGPAQWRQSPLTCPAQEPATEYIRSCTKRRQKTFTALKMADSGRKYSSRKRIERKPVFRVAGRFFTVAVAIDRSKPVYPLWSDGSEYRRSHLPPKPRQKSGCGIEKGTLDAHHTTGTASGSTVATLST